MPTKFLQNRWIAIVLTVSSVPFSCVSGTDLKTQDDNSPLTQSRPERPVWLEGTGADLHIRVTGEIFDENGKPAGNSHFEARRETVMGSVILNPELTGNQFSFRVPVKTSEWFRIDLKATSADGHQVATRTIMNFQLRQAAIDGVELTLQRTQRSVAVTVVHNQQPVPRATVTAELESGGRVSTVCDDNGIAKLRLMTRDRLHQLTALTDDFRVGGYAFHRDPPRDAAGDAFIIPLEKCRRQTIRLVNAPDGAPIPDLSFSLTVGTGPPNYQFTGTTPDSLLKTDISGEAVYRWFPDWEQHGAYVTISDPGWVRAEAFEMVNGVMVVPLRKSKSAERKRVTGHIRSTVGSLAGFCINASSFQGEEKNMSDALFAFTDETGAFEIDYLPGAIYCVCVNDERMVSDIIDLIPWNPDTQQVGEPSLTMSEGRPVEVIVTSGTSKRPMAWQSIQLETPHNFTWQENGETRMGGGARRWFVTTNKFGRAFTYALADHEVEGALYSPEWRSKESITVKTEGTTRLRFHRQVDTARRVFGRLTPVPNNPDDLQGAIIQIGSVDGETKERLTVMANADGTFAFDSKSLSVGMFARTKDSRSAAITVHEDLDEPVELLLKPTADFHGQLLGDNEMPLPSHGVRAVLRLFGETDFSKPYATVFDAEAFETKTDQHGHYTLKGLPCEVTLRLQADPVDGSKNDVRLPEFQLVPDKIRPREVSRLMKQKPGDPDND